MANNKSLLTPTRKLSIKHRLRQAFKFNSRPSKHKRSPASPRTPQRTERSSSHTPRTFSQALVGSSTLPRVTIKPHLRTCATMATCTTPSASIEDTSPTAAIVTYASSRSIALQHQDPSQITDAVIITTLPSSPFCCHEDLLAMTPGRLRKTAQALNERLPAALKIVVEDVDSVDVRRAIEVVVGIRRPVLAVATALIAAKTLASDPLPPSSAPSSPETTSTDGDQHDTDCESASCNNIPTGSRSPPTSPIDRHGNPLLRIYLPTCLTRLDEREDEYESPPSPTPDERRFRINPAAVARSATFTITEAGRPSGRTLKRTESSPCLQLLSRIPMSISSNAHQEVDGSARVVVDEDVAMDGLSPLPALFSSRHMAVSLAATQPSSPIIRSSQLESHLYSSYETPDQTSPGFLMSSSSSSPTVDMETSPLVARTNRVLAAARTAAMLRSPSILTRPGNPTPKAASAFSSTAVSAYVSFALSPEVTTPSASAGRSKIPVRSRTSLLSPSLSPTMTPTPDTRGCGRLKASAGFKTGLAARAVARERSQAVSGGVGGPKISSGAIGVGGRGFKSCSALPSSLLRGTGRPWISELVGEPREEDQDEDDVF